MKDREYLHKDFTELTEKDLQEMAEDFRQMEAEEAEKAEIDSRLNELQKQEEELDRQRKAKAIEFAAACVNLAISQFLKSFDPEALKDALQATLDAFQEYTKEHGGTVRGFFRDPDLPEILQQIRDRAVEILREKTAENDRKSKQPKAGPVAEGAPIWENDFLPEYNGDIVREFVKLAKGNFSPVELDDGTEILTADTAKGQISLMDPTNNKSAFLQAFGPLSVKLFDLGLVNLAYNNHYDPGRARNVRVDIDFLKFAEDQDRKIVAPENATEEEKEQARNRRNKFINEINQNLTDLSNFTWDIPGGRGGKVGIVQRSHWVRNGQITFFLDQGFADMVKRAGIEMQYPAALLKIDNKDQNAYKMGRAIANHHSNDRNAARGIESTLSVKSLIEYAPAVPTFEHLRGLSKKGRDWRTRIKAPLEKCFSEFVRVKYWEKWQYRNPTTGETYSPEQAYSLPASDFETLMVDYTVINAPDQTERRAKRLEELAARQEAAAAAGKKPKKPGRKPKNKE